MGRVIKRVLKIFKKDGKIDGQLIVLFGSCCLLLAFLLTHFIRVNYQHFMPQLAYFSRPFAIGFASVLVLTPLVMYFAQKLGALDHPSQRKDQEQPIPLLGGMSVYLGFLAVALLKQPWTPQFESIFIGGTIILVLGTIDDIYPLSSTVRIIGQLAAAIMVMTAGLTVSFMPESVVGYAIGSLITAVWILGITNAFNFADGVDGLAGEISVIASIFFFLITMHSAQYDVSLISITLAGCGLGFLCYNFKPARVYLGDGGSTFLGFMLACIALYGGWSDKGIIVALGIPSLILGVLIYDMCYITFSRIKNNLIKNVKEWLDFTGKDHFHHRLMQLGFKEEYAVLFIYCICVILGLSALVLANVERSFPVVVLMMQGGLIFVIVTMLMLAGRKLYIPKNVVEEVLPKNENVPQDIDDFTSGDELKKMLDEMQQLESEVDDEIALNEMMSEKKSDLKKIDLEFEQ